MLTFGVYPTPRGGRGGYDVGAVDAGRSSCTQVLVLVADVLPGVGTFGLCGEIWYLVFEAGGYGQERAGSGGSECRSSTRLVRVGG